MIGSCGAVGAARDLEHNSNRTTADALSAEKGPRPFQVERTAQTTALVVHLESKASALGRAPRSATAKRPHRSAETKLEEAVGLARAINLYVAETFIVVVQKVQPATFMGAGKVDEFAGIVAATKAELVIVNATLSPVQQRNLERAWTCKVLDRTGLILEIFGARARTKEGRLQVELAHLTYQKSRLVRSWTHLERQRGGLGFVGGPGETQIEADRRIIQQRITRLERQLDAVKKTRELHRASRRKVPYPVVALVGYTNAGKSTLFNRLSKADVKAEDLLFATLDPTMREVVLPSGRSVVLSDTVGFISDLPTTLIAAFRATLEEVLEADVIVHVRDVAHSDAEAQGRDVEDVLGQLGIDELRRARMIEVWNKIDLLDAEAGAIAKHLAARSEHNVVMLSAMTGEGGVRLLELLDAVLASGEREMAVRVLPEDGAELHWIYQNAEVLNRRDEEDGSTFLRIRLPESKLGNLARKSITVLPETS